MCSVLPLMTLGLQPARFRYCALERYERVLGF